MLSTIITPEMKKAMIWNWISEIDNGKYEIPKDSDKHSMFAGALWIGGLDDQGNLKVAGMTYRQDGNDFWPGPLNADIASDDYGTIGADVCSDFDKHFVILFWQVYVRC